MDEANAAQRLDRALAALAGVTRAQARRWIDEGRVHYRGRPARASQRVEAGERLEAAPPEPSQPSATPQAIPLALLHEDEDVVVVDKPAGLVVHPAPGSPSGTLVNALLHHGRALAGAGGVLRPGIVHRLDRGTSGVLVVAKSERAYDSLVEQFRSHSVERLYLALVRGVPGEDAGAADAPIGRHPVDRKRMSISTRSGREARTAWRVRRRFPASGVSLLEVRPETGRTHQIRVHLASRGLPVQGDAVYGRARGPGAGQPALHAARLGFRHPGSGEWLRFEAPLPAEFASELARLERREEAA